MEEAVSVMRGWVSDKVLRLVRKTGDAAPRCCSPFYKNQEIRVLIDKITAYGEVSAGLNGLNDYSFKLKNYEC